MVFRTGYRLEYKWSRTGYLSGQKWLCVGLCSQLMLIVGEGGQAVWPGVVVGGSRGTSLNHQVKQLSTNLPLW